MIKVGCILLSINFIIPIFLDRKKDLFTPIKIVSIYNFFAIIPYLWSVSNDFSKLDYYVLQKFSNESIERIILKYIIYQSIGFTIQMIVLFILDKKIDRENIKTQLAKLNYRKLRNLAIFSFILSTISYFLIMQKNGGVMSFLSNLQDRSKMLSGSSHLTTLFSLNIVVIFISLVFIKSKKNKIHTIFFVLYTIISILGYSSFGGRNSTVSLIILIIFIKNYLFSELQLRDIFKLWYLIVIVGAYIIIVPMFREQGYGERVKENPSIIVADILEKKDYVFKEISSLNQNIVAIGHFNNKNFWIGRSYLDMVFGFIPRSFYPQKPPIDDGVYIWNIVLGNNVRVNAPYSEMEKSSWPLETLGNSYANYGIIGIFIGMTILAIIQMSAYKNIFRYDINFMFSVIMYWNIMLNFNLINLKIISLITNYILIRIIFTIFKVYKVKE